MCPAFMIYKYENLKITKSKNVSLKKKPTNYVSSSTPDIKTGHTLPIKHN